MAYGFNDDRSKVQVLPTAGGTLTGALTGTDATFDGVTSNTADIGSVEADTVQAGSVTSDAITADDATIEDAVVTGDLSIDGASVDVDGTPAYLTFITDDIATFSPPTGIESCLVLDTTDNGLYHFTV